MVVFIMLLELLFKLYLIELLGYPRRLRRLILLMSLLMTPLQSSLLSLQLALFTTLPLVLLKVGADRAASTPFMGLLQVMITTNGLGLMLI